MNLINYCHKRVALFDVHIFSGRRTLSTTMLAGKTIFITGSSRGIGKAIALKCAKDGANIVIAAKTVDPHPKLPGTIHTAVEEGLTEYFFNNDSNLPVSAIMCRSMA